MNTKRAGAVGKRFGLHPDTIRSWAAQFAEFFSPGARDGTEIQKEFNYDDEIIVNTIHELRKQKIDFEEIRARLAAGERVTTLPPTTEPVPPETQLAVYNELRELKVQISERDAEIVRLRREGEKHIDEIRHQDREIAVLKYRLEQLEEKDDK